ncbi:MAG TPA: hypothetical protein P5250_02065 [Bacteroidales bacterium]|nr:hypothetical protein [Bacteroidales bacterium]
MKKLAIIIFNFLVYFSIYSQNIPTILIDGQPAVATGFTDSPYWLKEGQTLDKGVSVNSISVIQYNIASSPSGGNLLQFEGVINVTSQQTVPLGKAWKIESVAIDPSAIIFGGDNLGNHTATTNLNMSNYKIYNLADPNDLNHAVNVKTIENNTLQFAIDNGTTNAYSVNLSPAPLSYVTGMLVSFKANSSNTGPATLNVNGLGPKPIRKQSNFDLIANDIKLNQIVTVIYDGNNFQMTSIVGNDAQLPSGAVVLLYADETTSTYSVNSPGGTNNSVKSYTLPNNTYSKILIETEGTITVGANGGSTNTGTVTITVGGNDDKSTNLSRPVSDYASWTVPYALKTSIIQQASTTIAIKASLSLGGSTSGSISVKSLRVYGIY